MVLETIASKVLSSYLGDYVEGLDTKNLDVSITSGEAELSNLRLKKTALDGLELPVTIKEGYLTKVRMKIPWRNLGSEPAIARVEGLYILVSPQPKTNEQISMVEARKWASKSRALQIAELLGLDEPDKDEAEKKREAEKKKKKEEGFFAELQMKLVNNLQIYVDKIHIRYEDDSSGGRPFAFGITLDKFHAQSTDGNFNSAFIKLKEEMLYKLVTLQNLAIYWDTPADGNVILNYKNPADLAAQMEALIFRQDPKDPTLRAPVHQYILKPVSGRLKATLGQGAPFKMDVPQTKIDLELDSITLGLNRFQFSSVTELLQYFVLYTKSLKYLSHRPPIEHRPNKFPRAWWKYAQMSVRSDIREKYYRWSWEYIKKRKQERTTYVDLYKRKARGKKLSSKDKDALESLEKTLEYDDIIVYRKLANAGAKLHDQQKKRKKDLEKQAKEQQERDAKEAKEKKKSDKSSSSKSSPSSDTKHSSHSDKKKKHSTDKDKSKSKKKKENQDEGIKGFFKSIFSSDDKEKEKEKEKKSDKPKDAPASSGSKDKLKSSGSSSAASSSAPGSPSSQKALDEDFAAQALKELYSAIGYSEESQTKQSEFPKEYVETAVSFVLKKATLEIREDINNDSVLAALDFSGVTVGLGLRPEDSISVTAKLKTVSATDFYTLKPKNVAGSSLTYSLPMMIPDATRIQDSEEPIVSLALDVSPPDAPKDSLPIDLRMKLRVLPVSITFSRVLADRVGALFKPDKTVIQSLENTVREVANQGIDAVVERAQNSLKYALAQRRLVLLDVDLMAPRITVPEHFTDNTSPAIFADLGHFTLTTDASAQIKTSQTSQVTEDYFYDTYRLNIEGLTSLVLPDRSKTIDWTDRAAIRRMALIDKFDMKFQMQVANTESVDLPKIKLSGVLPSFNVDVTKDKLTLIVQILKGVVNPEEVEPLPPAPKKIKKRRDPSAPKKKKKRKARILEGTNTDLLDEKKRDQLVSFVYDAFQSGQKKAPNRNSSDDKALAGKSKPALTSSGKESPIAVLKKLAEVSFEIGRVGFTLNQDINLGSAVRPFPVIVFDLRGLNLKVWASTLDVKVRVLLAGIFIEDSLAERVDEIRGLLANNPPPAPSMARGEGPQPTPTGLTLSQGSSASLLPRPAKRWLLRAGSDRNSLDLNSATVSSADLLIAINVDAIDKRAPHYKGVDVAVKVTMGNIELGVCRPTVAAILQTATDFGSMLDAAQLLPATPPPAPPSVPTSPDVSDSEDDYPDVDLEFSTKEDPTLLADVSISVTGVKVSLLKDNNDFFTLQLNKLATAITVKPDGKAHVEGFLGSLSVKDRAQPKWGDFVSMEGEKVVTFVIDAWPDKLAVSYPGYDVSLNLSVSTLKFVVLTQILAELEIYFSAFMKMRQLLGYVDTPTAATAAKLNITVSNPLIIIPKSSQDDEYLCVDLGKIKISNTLLSTQGKQKPPFVTDNMGVEINSLNVSVYTFNPSKKLAQTSIIHNLNVLIDIVRPLTWSPKSNQPQATVNINLPQITIDLALEKLQFLTTIMSGNMSELPLRPDENELKLVFEFLQSVNFKLLLPPEPPKDPVTGVVQTSQAAMQAKVNLSLKKVAVSLLSGNGVTYDGISTSVLKVTVDNIGIFVQVFDDRTIKLNFSMESLGLEDSRVNTTNKFKQIIGTSPQTAMKSESPGISSPNLITSTGSPALPATSHNELSLLFENQPQNGKQWIELRLARPRIYVVPNHLLSIIEMLFPWLKQLLRAGEMFSQRLDFGTAADNQRALMIEQGNLKQRHIAEYQELLKQQATEIRAKQTELGKLQASIRPPPNAAALETKILQDLADLKQAHNKKVRALKGVQHEQFSALKTSQAELLQRATSILDFTRDYLKKAAATDSLIEAPSEIKERKVKLNVEAPEIVLLTDSEQPVTSALVIHLGDSKVNITLRDTEATEVDFTLADFDAFKCEIKATSNVFTDKTVLLQPFKVGANLLQKADQLSADFDVTSLNTIISYRDLRLAFGVVKSFLPLLKTVQDELNKEKAVVEAISQIVSQAAASIATQALQQAAPKGQATDVDTQLTFKMHTSSFTLINDLDETAITPLIRAEMDDLNANIRLIAKSVSLNGNMKSMMVLAYNSDLSGYEPVIEPWDLTFIVKQADSVVVKILTDKMLAMNVSKSLIDTAFNIKSFAEDLTGEVLEALGLQPPAPANAPKKIATPKGTPTFGSPQNKLERSFSPFLIRNDCYRSIRYWSSNQDESSAIEINPGEELPISVLSAGPVSSHTPTSSPTPAPSPLIDIRIIGLGDESVIHRVAVDKVQARRYDVSLANDETNRLVVVDVLRRGGTKVLTVRTGKSIENQTPRPIEVLASTEGKQTPWGTVIQPGAKVPIPLEFFKLSTLQIRPALDKDNTWDYYPWKSTNAGAAVICRDKSGNIFNCSLNYLDAETAGDESIVEATIVFRPLFILENLLPSSFIYRMASNPAGLKPTNSGMTFDFSDGLQPGKEVSIYDTKKEAISLYSIIFQIAACEWSAIVDLNAIAKARPPKIPIDMAHTSGFRMKFFAELTEPYFGTIKMSIYAPYWIVNQTGLPLAYRFNSKSPRMTVVEGRKNPDLTKDPSNWYPFLTESESREAVVSKEAAQKFIWSSDEVCFEVAGKVWSDRFALARGPQGQRQDVLETLVVNDKSANKSYSFVVTVATAPAPFFRTQEVRLVPQYILYNKTKETVEYYQAIPGDDTSFYSLPANQSVPFHWPNPSKDKLLKARYKGADLNFSGRFKIDVVESFSVKCRPKTAANDVYFKRINLTIKQVDNVYYVVFRPIEEISVAQYIVDNQTPYTFTLQQKGLKTLELLEPKKSIPFTWDEPHQPTGKLLEIRVRNNDKVRSAVDFDKKKHPDWDISTTKLQMVAGVKGFTKVLFIYQDNDPQQKAHVEKLTTTGTSVATENINLEVQLGGIGISIIDTTPQEITFVSFKDLRLTMIQTPADTQVEFLAESLQVDNQLYRAPAPVLLAPSEDLSAPPAKAHQKPPLLKFATTIDTSQPGVKYFKYLEVGLNPIDVNLDQLFILKVASVADNFVKYLDFLSTDLATSILAKELVLPALSSEDLVVDTFFFQNVQLAPIKVILSLRKSANQKVLQTLNASQASIRRILDIVVTLSSIEGAEIGLNKFNLEQSAICSLSDFQNRLQSHYLSQVKSIAAALLFNYVNKFKTLLAKTKKELRPVRNPRFFPVDDLLVLYDKEKSYGQKLLRSLKGRAFLEDHYIFHLLIDQFCFIVSVNFVTCTNDAATTVHWKESVNDIMYKAQGTEIKLTTAPGVKKGKQISRSIACKTPEQAASLQLHLHSVIKQAE